MKDDRLYARFTLDFPDSPKFIALSVEAKWAYVEMVIYSRRQLTDGFLANAVALAKWGASVCLELLENDPVNPSLIEVENGYQIHDFAKHQTTKEDIKSLSEKRKAAGRKGGLASAQAKAKQVLKQNGSKIKPETETESKRSSSNAARSTPYTDEFLDWYKHYPRKVGKGAAAKAYGKLTADERATLNDITHTYAASVQDSEERFIPHPATWLNERRFDDHTEPAPTPVEFLRDCWKCGTTAKITELTGYQPDVFRWPGPVPDNFDQDAALLEHRRAWIDANRDDLARALGAVL